MPAPESIELYVEVFNFVYKEGPVETALGITCVKPALQYYQVGVYAAKFHFAV
jgi:hypothetical protein